MGIHERKEREKNQKRELVIEAAEELFLSQGVESTSIQDIAAKAEISKGSIYSYFKDKDDLLQEILLKSFEILKTLLIKAVEPQMTGREKLEALGCAYLDFYHEYPREFFFTGLVEVLGTPSILALNLDTPFGHVLKDLKSYLVWVTQEGVRDGSLRPDLDCEKTSLVISQIVMSFIQKMARAGGLFEKNMGYAPQILIEEMFSLVLHSIKNPEEGHR